MSGEMLLSVKNLSISIYSRLLFEGLSLSLHRGNCIALAGPNGCGKTTILRLIVSRLADTVDPHQSLGITIGGQISTSFEPDYSYLPQYLEPDDPLWDRILIEASWIDSHAVRLMDDFGLADTNFNWGAASEGERQKRAIVEGLMLSADVYLLDEPTNYLDLPGIAALEEHLRRLKESGSGILLVSHDRRLTDNVADETYLISDHGIYHTIGGASNAIEVREHDRDSRRRAAGAIRKKIQQLQQDSLAKAGWAKSKEKQKIGAKGAKGHISRLSAKLAKRAKVAQKRIDKESRQLAEVKPFVPKELNLSFPKYEIRNRQVFSLEDIDFAYGQAPLLESISLGAATNDKICLMGANGSGKSTLINIALGYIEPNSGEWKINEGVRTAYLPQGLMDFFAEGSLLENFADVDLSETKIRQYLGAALIRKDRVNRPVTEFSAGELMRAAVVKCILSKAEFLFLDEPTSHLDLESIEILERLLQDFEGGFLTVSHDRAFIENIADRLYYLEDGHLRLV